MVNIIIDSDIVTIGSKLISISFGLVGLFLLFEIKSRVIETLKPTFVYFIMADICMIIIRTLGIMDQVGLLVSTFYDSAIVIFSLFLLMAILSFYKFTTKVTKQIEKNISEPEANKEQPQTHMIYANKLDAMEDKIEKIENKIKTGRVKSAEAIQMAERLKIQLSLLDKAYKEGYISKVAYERGREKIKDVHENIKEKYL